MTTTTTKKSIGKHFKLIDFYTYDHIEKEDDDDSSSNSEKVKKQEKQFHIQMFGLTEQGETASITVNDFQPFFYIKVGDQWDQGQANALLDFIKSKTRYLAKDILSVELIDQYKLYGFTGGKKSKFAKIVFKTYQAFQKVKGLWYRYDEHTNQRIPQPFKFENIQLILYESTIPPILRYFHIKNISPSGWILLNTSRCKPTPASLKETTCKYEYSTSSKWITSSIEKESRVPYKICSFDIEASSSHGDFPIPIKSYKRLATNIVDCFQTHSKVLTDPVRQKTLVKKMILSAFDFGTFDGIDRVFPIEKKIEKEEIERLTNELLDKSISITEDMMSDSSTIESLFEKMKESTATFKEEEENDCEDSDIDEDDQDTKKHIQQRYKKKSKIVSLSIIDIFKSEDYSREQKITILNNLFFKTDTKDSSTVIDSFPKLEGDKVTFIGSTFMRYGEQEPYLNHCLVLNTCDPVENAQIHTVTEEKDLLLQWTQLIQRENPDIIIGYNIFGFDYEFMFRRAQENGCERAFLELSRMINNDFVDVPTLENTKIQIASGEYDLRYPKMTGRLQIDMYSYFRRDFNLSSYKLDDVAGQFISDRIHKIELDESSGTTRIYSKNLAGLHTGDYIHIQISNFSSDFYRGGEKLKVVDILLDQIIMETVKGKETETKYNIIIVRGIHDLAGITGSLEWTMAKDDVTPQDIFRLANGTSAERAIVAKYCIQDCNLVHHLMNKIDVLTGYIEMSRICSVPISYLVFRGQGIKLTSYVAKKCREKGTLMPDLEKKSGGDGYEGAIVLPPKCSMYIDNPVACVDYSSLYPSSMISQNYSHDSKVWSKEYDLEGNLIRETGEKFLSGTRKGEYKYDNLTGYQYINIEFDTFKYLRVKGPKSKEVKTKVGKKICRWAQLPNNEKSIMPAILTELLDARANTRKKAKNEADPFMQNILDKRQLGYKVTANSLYGQCGARTSTFFEQDVAASTTATGRMMITYAKRIIEDVYGDRVYETACQGPLRCKAEYVYGDSVANYTPVTIRVNGIPEIVTIENLAEKYGNNKWILCDEPGKQTKEFCELSGVESWTENGWTPLFRIIRHTLASHKKMIRILTHTGMVDVTDDHSLLKIDKEEISPKDCIVGSELLHNQLPTPNISNTQVTLEQAKIMGFFFGDGSCGLYNCPSGKKSSWALNNASEYLLDKYINLCNIAYPEFEWSIMDTIESSGVYKISPRSSTYGSISKFVQEYRSKMYYNNSKIIPLEIMNSSFEIREAFWEGMYDADGDKDSKGYIRIDQKSQISASHISWLASSLGWNISINTRNDKPNIYRVTMTTLKQRKNSNAIKKMYEIPYQGYVYDLTTQNHHFAAGIGNLIVHNTDSVFFTFNLENPNTGEKIRGKPALEATIEIAQDAAELCTSYLKPPMALAYEKTLMPFLLLSKKRYVGMLYEEDPNKGKLKYMGLVLKRRDNCDLVKDIYGGVLDKLMKHTDIQPAIDFLYDSLNDLIQGKIPIEKLTITKSLRSDYKNPQQIAHRVLADRISQRDPGNKPKPGDRIPYVFIVNPKASLQGEKIETPQFVLDNKLKLDYTYYITNQLMKPLQQLFGLAIEKIWKLQNKTTAIKTFHKDMGVLQAECHNDLEIFMKKKEKYTTAKIKTLLFDKFLLKIHQEQNGIRTITECFGRK